MADHSRWDDPASKLHAMKQQAGCLVEYLRRGDLDLARWLVAELERQLREIDSGELDG